MIQPGDVVVATRDGGHDREGLPFMRPSAGKTYRITSIYAMNYGLGCTLAGMDPRPYRGYFLHVRGKSGRAGWYFAKLDVADQEFTEWLKNTLSRSAAAPEQRPRSSQRKRKAAP